MTSPLALTVEEVAALSRIASQRSKTSSGYHMELAVALNAIIESKRQQQIPSEERMPDADLRQYIVSPKGIS